MSSERVITEVTAIPAFEKGYLRQGHEYSTPLLDYRIRHLNTDIDKLMREKHMWEVQLRNLGGPYNISFCPKTYLEGGCEVPDSRGYKYFDHARVLPGVKRLFYELKPSKRAADGKDQERRLRAEKRGGMWMRITTASIGMRIMGRRRWCCRNVERAGEDGALQGWTPIPGVGG
ncbi:Isy1-like splicing family-domain-containing protein [Tuber borchii]|uniref:Isy1-like splicing family-domain-containing protein n=1 Tax=Tuber borchii TaxID=42251 RepID=A0A2T7A235_TUBBO|nr:Isy1-like splicing family-domain-containing protein [Tuber borchii]